MLKIIEDSVVDSHLSAMVISEVRSLLRPDATIGAGTEAAAGKKKPKRTSKEHGRESADAQEGEAPPPSSSPQSKLSVLRLLNEQKEALFGQLLEVFMIIINKYFLRSIQLNSQDREEEDGDHGRDHGRQRAHDGGVARRRRFDLRGEGEEEWRRKLPIRFRSAVKYAKNVERPSRGRS